MKIINGFIVVKRRSNALPQMLRSLRIVKHSNGKKQFFGEIRF